MDKKYWDDIFKNYNTEIFDVLKSDKKGVIKSRLKKAASSEKKVADFGCGIGKWLPTLSKQFKEVAAIDFSSSNMEYNAQRYQALKNVRYQTIDMTVKLKAFAQFDTILCVNAILTEIHSMRKNFFENIAKNLKKKGNLILVVPSLESSLHSSITIDKCNREQGIKSNEPKFTNSDMEYRKFRQGIVNIDHVATKHYLKEELISTLTENGFINIEFDKVEYPWSSEMENVPKSLKGPYPWDWVVSASKK